MKFWCHDSDQGTSPGRSISRPPVPCSVRKIHLWPQVLRPTSPRNITSILNQVSGLFLLSSPTSLTIPQPLSPFYLCATLQSLPSLNFSSFPFLVETGDTFYPWTQNSGAGHGLGKTDFPWCLITRGRLPDYSPTFQRCLATQGCLPWSFTLSGKYRCSRGQESSRPLLSVSLLLLCFSGKQEPPNPFSPCLYPFSTFLGGKNPLTLSLHGSTLSFLWACLLHYGQASSLHYPFFSLSLCS